MPLDVHALLTFVKPYQRIEVSHSRDSRADETVDANKESITIRIETA
jgi:hypothetical protein